MHLGHGGYGFFFLYYHTPPIIKHNGRYVIIVAHHPVICILLTVPFGKCQSYLKAVQRPISSF